MGLPGSTDRTLIVGQTGSGKSVAGLWHLSRQNFDQMPWVIIDYKRDGQFKSIRGIVEWNMDKGAPEEPGLYIVYPRVKKDDDAMEDFLYSVLDTGYTGLLLDEGYMIDKGSDALMSVYVTGRSKHVPIITLSQRPTRINRFAVSEAGFYQIYHLNDRRDRKTVEEFVPHQDLPRLPQYWSYFYDVKADQFVKMKPLPPEEMSIELIESRLEPPEQERIHLAKK